MTGQLLLSIAIPNFNYERYLFRCLASAVKQEGDDIEILVADNCSTDDSWRVIEAIEDRRIRVWRHSRNIGLYPNWNFLLRQARGRYFKLLQSDDWLEPDFIRSVRRLIASVSDENIIALLLGYRISYERDPTDLHMSDSDIPSTTLPSIFSPGSDFDAALRSLNYSMPTLNVINTELARRLGGYKPETSMRADSILFAGLLGLKPSWLVVSCDTVVAVTRVHRANDRGKYSRFSAFFDEILILNAMSSMARDTSDCQKLQLLKSRAAGQALISLPIDLARRKNLAEFWMHFRQLCEERLLWLACTMLPREAWRTAIKRSLFV